MMDSKIPAGSHAEGPPPRKSAKARLELAVARSWPVWFCVALAALAVQLRPQPFRKLGAEQPVLSVLVDGGGVMSKAMDQAGLYQLSSDGTKSCAFVFWLCHGGKVTGITRAKYLSDGKAPPIPLPSDDKPLEASLSPSDIPSADAIPARNDVDPHWAQLDAQRFVDDLALTVVRSDGLSGRKPNIRVYVDVDKESYDAAFVAEAVQRKALAAIRVLTKAPTQEEQREIEQKAARARSWNP